MVEDDFEVVEFCARAGYVNDCRVTGSVTGRDTVEGPRRQRLGLVLPDIKMAGTDRLETVPASKRIDPSIVGIVTTEHDSVETVVRTLCVGWYQVRSSSTRKGSRIGLQH